MSNIGRVTPRLSLVSVDRGSRVPDTTNGTELPSCEMSDWLFQADLLIGRQWRQCCKGMTLGWCKTHYSKLSSDAPFSYSRFWPRFATIHLFVDSREDSRNGVVNDPGGSWGIGKGREGSTNVSNCLKLSWLSHDYFEMQHYRNTIVTHSWLFVGSYYDKPRMSYAPTHPLRLHCDPPTISPRSRYDPSRFPRIPLLSPTDHPRLLTTALRMCHACATHACGCFQPDKRTRLEPTTSVASKIS